MELICVKKRIPCVSEHTIKKEFIKWIKKHTGKELDELLQECQEILVPYIERNDYWAIHATYLTTHPSSPIAPSLIVSSEFQWNKIFLIFWMADHCIIEHTCLAWKYVSIFNEIQNNNLKKLITILCGGAQKKATVATNSKAGSKRFVVSHVGSSSTSCVLTCRNCPHFLWKESEFLL